MSGDGDTTAGCAIVKTIPRLEPVNKNTSWLMVVSLRSSTGSTGLKSVDGMSLERWTAIGNNPAEETMLGSQRRVNDQDLGGMVK